MQWKQLFFVLIIVHAQSLKTLSGIYDDLNQIALNLNNLISKYQNNNEKLSLEDQASYVAWLKEFNVEVQNAKNEATVSSAKLKLNQIESRYQKVYEQNAQVLVKDPSLINELKRNSIIKIKKNLDMIDDQLKSDPKLLEELEQNKKSLIDQSELENDSTVDFNKDEVVQDIGKEQLIIQKGQDLLTVMVEHINNAQNVFNTTAQNLLPDESAKFTKINVENFKNDLQQAFLQFCSTVKVHQILVIGQYVAFVEELNPDFDYNHLSIENKLFVQGINNLSMRATLNVQACMIDLTSHSVKAVMINTIELDLKQSEDATQQEYNKLLASNQEKLNKSWWSELKQFGKGVLNQFSKEFKIAILKEVKKTFIEESKHITGAIGHEVIKVVKEQIVPVAGQAINDFVAKLPTETLMQFVQDKNSVAQVLKSEIQKLNPVPELSKQVAVTKNSKLGAQENIFRANRMKKIEQNLAMLGIEKPLAMAFCCSGGGVRAQLGTLGIMLAASRANILQSCMYMAGLSGSTWTIAPWSYSYAMGKIGSDYTQSLNALRTDFVTSLNNSNAISIGKGIYAPARLSGAEASIFAKQVASRAAYDQEVSVVDLYGALVGNFSLNLLGRNKSYASWSDTAKKIEEGVIPLPLCSAIFDLNYASQTDSTTNAQQYEWFEMGPFQAGSPILGYIPIQYFGSKFEKGILQKGVGQQCPEYPLNFFLGVYGSAFSLNFDDVFNQVLKNPTFTVGTQEITLPVDEWMKNIVNEEFGMATRFKRVKKMYALFSNFSFGVPSSAMAYKESIALVDAGIHFNFPLPILLDRAERKIDLIFMYDSNPGDQKDLKVAAKYFNRKDIVIPKIDTITKKELIKNVMTVFNDPRKTDYNQNSPTFIYFPTRPTMAVPEALNWPTENNLVENVKVEEKSFDVTKAPYTTSNFKYTPEEMNDLIDAIDYAFTSQLPDIIEIIKQVAAKRSSTQSLA